MERPWRIVGPLGQPSNGLLWMSKTAGVLFVTATCTFATIVIIICGPWRGRHRWSIVWDAVQTPHARVEGVPSAPQPHCPSACHAGVEAGMCFAGWAIAALPVIGQCL